MRTLGDIEYDEAWEAFYKNFSFHPSVNGPFPAIAEPNDSITFQLAQNHDDAMIDELSKAICQSFIECGLSTQEVYYLDWQHECYALITDEISTSWATGYPDGDYAIFASKDMSTGTFGHPWEPSICFFGQSFVNALLKRKPAILRCAIRNAGGYSGT